ncbi:MAG TPA: hypothetical protein VK923_04340 [Euzebyales bacterium]|nr:hypothetical protein [Euzebyales bacterium]
MLEHLVGVDHVQGPVRHVQVVGVADAELDRGHAGLRGVTSCLVEDVVDVVDPDGRPGHHVASEVDRRRPGAASHVEQCQTRPQVGAAGRRPSWRPCASERRTLSWWPWV